MIFFFCLLVMWSMAILLLQMNSTEKTNVWFGRLFFVQGLGVIEALIEVQLIPMFLDCSQILWRIRWLLASICFRLFPYCLIMAGISYCEFPNFKWKKRLTYLLFVPVIMTFILDFIFVRDGFLYSDLPKSKLYWMTYIWTIPYYLFSNFLFLRACFKESNALKRQQRLLAFVVLALPTVVIMIMTVTIAPSSDWWKHFITQCFCSAGVFLYFIGKYGLEGLKVRLEKEYESGSISGATIISHTIKNELSKIHCNIEGLRKGICDPEKVINNIDIATEHLYEIVDRVDRHIQEFSLQYENHNLVEMFDAILLSFEPVFCKDNIQVIKNYWSRPVIYCDKAHFTEVLNNILINAIEAIDGAYGKIVVEVITIPKQVIIKISDNGQGIPKDKIGVVTNLFYSTKKSNVQVRGTGLYYCAAIIKKHHGELNISSEPGIETTVTIKIPFNFPALNANIISTLMPID
jgi:two-component system sporulation sensor kinase B